MIVSIGLFVTVLFIATSAFLSVLSADNASSATRMTTDNLNVALEDMTRLLKTGTGYKCGSSQGDCLGGESSISFTDQDGRRVTYTLNVGTNQISRTIDDGPAILVTAPEIQVDTLKFIVKGTDRFDDGDTVQPSVVIQISGQMPRGKNAAPFSIQTMVTQRAYDI